MNIICIDAEHGLIRRYTVILATIHDSQLLSRLLDPENQHDYVWADSLYSGECFEDLLRSVALRVASTKWCMQSPA